MIDADPDFVRRTARPLREGEDVVAAKDFDEFARISDDEETIITVKAGDPGRLIRGVNFAGTVLIDFDGRIVEIWPSMIRSLER